MGEEKVLADVKKAVKKTVGQKKVKQLLMAAQESMLATTGYAEQLLFIKGIGVITASTFLGEVGDPLHFQNAKQIAKLAAYNLVEDSSDKNKSARLSLSVAEKVLAACFIRWHLPWSARTKK